MVLLPALVLRPEIISARMLKVGGKDDGLVAGFPRELNSKIPGIQGDKRELEVVCEQMLVRKRIEAIDSITKGSSRTNMFPCQGS